MRFYFDCHPYAADAEQNVVLFCNLRGTLDGQVKIDLGQEDGGLGNTELAAELRLLKARESVKEHLGFL